MGERLVGEQVGPDLPTLLSRANWDEKDPMRDGRVKWLLNELDSICSSLALHNLCIDIIREHQGGKNPPPAIPIDCSEAEREDGIQQRPNQEGRIHERDIQFAWKGLLALRKSESGDSKDDVLLLLLVLAENPEIEAGFTGQWPIKAIVVLLNARDRNRSWTPRNVDNIKEKLARWIAKKKQGFNHFEDFLAFLAGVGRKLESGKGTGDGYRDASRDRSLH
jgi:hypothetical protein